MTQVDSPFVPWRTFETIPGLVDWAAETYGDAPFVVDEDGASLSFVELRIAANRAAEAFGAIGVSPGDRVAIWAPNGSRWIVAALGAQLVGAALVPINTRFRGAEAGVVLEDSEATVLVTVGDFLGVDYVDMLQKAMGGVSAERLVVELSALTTIVALDDKAQHGATTWSAFLGVGNQSMSKVAQSHQAEVDADTIADILFTSGTTGRAKGAMHSHAQALWAVERLCFVNDYRRGDRMLIVNPFFHSFGYRAGWMCCLVAGATAYPVAVFDTERVLHIIEREKITLLPGPPTLFQSIIDYPSRQDVDLSSLRVGTSGSANFPEELAQRAHDQLGFDLFLTSYGLTEATAIATSCRAGDSFATIAQTVGRGFPDVEIAIAGDDGAFAKVGDAGEVLVRGFNIMKGYLNDAQATTDAVDKDGWLHTGDVGALDKDGGLRILDRLKDVVLVGGFNVYPAEVEVALREHPAIADVAIVSAPDTRLGEVCAAFAVLNAGASLTADELRTWSRARMANFKVPRHLVVVETLPRTALGKVRKNLLRDEAQQLV